MVITSQRLQHLKSPCPSARAPCGSLQNSFLKVRSLFGYNSPAGPAPTMQMWLLGLGALVTEGWWRSAVIFCEGFGVVFIVCEDFVDSVTI